MKMIACLQPLPSQSRSSPPANLPTSFTAHQNKLGAGKGGGVLSEPTLPPDAISWTVAAADLAEGWDQVAVLPEDEGSVGRECTDDEYEVRDSLRWQHGHSVVGSSSKVPVVRLKIMGRSKQSKHPCKQDKTYAEVA